MNYAKEDIQVGALRDRARIGSSLADVDPMNIDRSVTFEQVGGLGKHVQKLKEMVVFPLLYPEVFERFKISPPRGVLFYGPPGKLCFQCYQQCSIFTIEDLIMEISRES